MKKYLNYFISIFLIIFFWKMFNYDVLSSISIGIFAYWISSLIIRANDSLPIKELFLSLYSLQYLFSAALTFNGFDQYNIESYKMKITSFQYFSYTLPVFLAFSLGFNLFSKSYNLKIDRDNIDRWLNNNKNLPYHFIIIGFIAPIISNFIPSSLAFVAYLLECFKFIGLFILVMSYQKIKPILLITIYGLIIFSSFQGGMFHDLLTWLIVLGLILAFRYKPNWKLKLLSIFLFVSFAIFIQSIKGGLREITWSGNEQASIDLIQNINKENSLDKGGFFSKDNLGPHLNRVNQGWILASTIDNLSNNADHTHGTLIIEYLYSAIMPRVFAPNKLNAGSQTIFNQYSGHFIGSETSMGLGLFADAYIEFGQFGAIIYVFLFGLMYGYIMNQFFVRSKKFPILILFTVLAFIYAMRPDCETQTVLGHLFKTIMLLVIIFTFFKKTFELPRITLMRT
jgi:hypothetical protein